TFGIQMVRGRSFGAQDTEHSPRVAVVSENFVRKYFAGADQIGKRVFVEKLVPGKAQFGSPLEWEIVGIFHNVRYVDLHDDDITEMDVPIAQSPWPRVAVGVRTAGDPLAMTKSIAAALNSIVPDVALA